jgi:hypothetical protein
MNAPAARRRRRNRHFDFAAKRRREIVLHARYVGAMDTEDRNRWLIAWHWHNPEAKDPIWSLMDRAKNMGGKINEAQASAITEEASITRMHRTADSLAKFLGVTFEQRQRLGLTTIGSVNVGRRARKELRKVQNRRAHEKRRRTQGIQSRAEYEANSVAAQARKEGVSRMTIYRRRKAAERTRNTPNVTGVSAPIFLSSEDGPVTPAGVEGTSERGFASKKARGLPSSQTATTLAADIHGSLPLELRLLALCLPMPENLARAA